MLGYGFKDLRLAVEKKGGVLQGMLDGAKVEVKNLEDFYLSASEIKEN